MQRIATFFLILILSALPVLSIAMSVIPVTTTHADSCCPTQTSQLSKQHDYHDCCSSGECDCDTAYFNNSITSNSIILLTFYNQFQFYQYFSPSFISSPPDFLYRPPRIIL